MSGVPNRTGDGYEKGLAMALHQGEDHGDPGVWASTGEWSPEAQPQSVHVAAPKWAAPNLANAQGGVETNSPAAAVQAFEMMAETFEREPRKNEARDLCSGKTLGECGDLLSKWLLEVLSLRSQSTGRAYSRNVFPLPTSSSALMTFDPTLNVNEVNWACCVALSLNSMWGADLSNGAEPNEPQKLCLAGIV